jgi:hypothetical protein
MNLRRSFERIDDERWCLAASCAVPPVAIVSGSQAMRMLARRAVAFKESFFFLTLGFFFSAPRPC